MESDYDPIQRLNDAVAFATSRFGTHYLLILENEKARALSQTMNGSLSDRERAHYGTVAATNEKQLEYFRAAQQTIADPSMLQKLRDGIQKRLKKREATDQV